MKLLDLVKELAYGLSGRGGIVRFQTLLQSPHSKADSASPDTILETKIREALPRFESPFPDATNEQWTRYVLRMRRGKCRTVGPFYHLGFFLVGMRQLEICGMVENVIKRSYQGRQVWMGDWKEPYFLVQFLGDPKLQYSVFEDLSRRNYDDIKGDRRFISGAFSTGSENASLSGLLGIFYIAGKDGARSWLCGDRKQLTTEIFNRVNGIF